MRDIGRGRAAEGLRLALFSGNYNYTRDGANQALNRLVGHLEGQGAAVRVYSPTTAAPAFAPVGELVSAPSIAFPGRPDYRLALGLPRALRRDIAAFAPTAMHLSAPDLLGLAAARLARAQGLPLVASLHTRFETYLAHYGLGWLRPALEQRLNRFYDGCDVVLAPNRPIAEQLSAVCPRPAVRLWLRGVDRAQFAPEHRSLDWRRAVGLADDDVALLFLGRLVPEKGLDTLVETVRALEARHARIRPLIVGDGPAAAWLRPRLAGGVFTGFLVGEALGRAVASADILFNPSRTEAFGNATLEALAAGLPVVCPDAPSTRGLVSPGHDGFLVASGQPSDYAHAILALVHDRGLRARMGAAARAASQAYDWAASCAAVLEAYRETGAIPQAEPSVVAA